MGTSEDDSDYAYIDRSTHSITGYLQSPNNTNIKKDSNNFDSNNICKKKRFGKGNNGGADQTATINLLLANSFESNGGVETDNNAIEESHIVDKMCSTTSFIDSPSPYATIQVMRKHRQQTKESLPQVNHLKGQNNLIHQRPHPGGFHTLKVQFPTFI